ncbi:hypothetical protein GCM10007893_13820 [Paracoccus marinus]|nr:hypothetical protein GCM10007893_13820 [Paracoccus marinus]
MLFMMTIGSAATAVGMNWFGTGECGICGGIGPGLPEGAGIVSGDMSGAGAQAASASIAAMIRDRVRFIPAVCRSRATMQPRTDHDQASGALRPARRALYPPP